MRFGSLIVLFASAELLLADSNKGQETPVTNTNTPAVTNAAPAKGLTAEEYRQLAIRSEQMRMACIEGRRYVCGRVLDVLPDGLVVDSGYSKLLSPPFNQSWVVRGNATVERDAAQVEEKKPDAVCVGQVFLINTPKKPAVKPFDYVVIHGYPAGERNYSPVPGVQKTLRTFSASLERAVAINIEHEKPSPKK